jgi:pyruvate dehydrogenase E1 component beta subunit
VVYEAMRTGGFGAEVAARIAEEALDYLQAPIVRVAGWDAPYPPFSAVENFYRPDARRVLEAVRRVLTH